MKCPRCHSENRDDSKFCSDCGSPLSPGAKAGAGAERASLTKTLETPVRLLKPGAVIAGKYRIVEEVGAGGMGVVYKAEDLKLKRAVALKFLPPHLMDAPELKERFLIEAQAAAALSHPNICTIHEVGEDEGRPYIAMEYVEGETLRDRIRKGPLEPEEAVDIINQVAAGLAEAHAKGIIHRDVKSANIMVTPKGQAKVMDFGLAKLRGGSSLTRSQTTLGTVAYMSPEQARGEELDPRTDIWSLGVVLYEMLTGELPFRGDRDLSIIHSIVHEEPKPIRERKPPVPEELQRIIARTLKKKREARYGSAEELLKDLKVFEAARRAEASGIFNLRSLANRLRRPVVAIPTGLAAVAITAATVWFFDRQAKVRWARQVALPEIERMIEANDAWRNLVEPYRLAEKVEAVIPHDAALADIFTKCSVKVDIKTEPPGAKISIKAFELPEEEWKYLGLSPLEKIRLPVGFFRWKFEKEGYATILAASSSWSGVSLMAGGPNDPYNLMRHLDKAESLPPGMVRVEETETPSGLLGSFFIDKYEVTNRQFKQFVDAGGYRKKDYWKHKFVRDGKELTWEEAMKEFVDQTGLPSPAGWQGGDYPTGQADYPVSGISWYEAAAYAEYVGKSLPTSDHWDVARGGFTPMIQWPQLGGFALLAPFCNFQGKGPVPVGSLQGISPYGAFDMSGNVREWCWNETPVGRVVRGGSWRDNTYEAGNVRHAPPMDRSDRNGFRLALYPEPESVPEESTGFISLGEVRNFYEIEPVPDPIFRVYKEQFSYDKTDLNDRVESREENPDGWIHETVSFDAAYGGERVLAHLFLPQNVPTPYQTVIYFPGSASTWVRSSQDIESYYEFPMFLSFIVKNGRAALYPIYKGTFERGSPELSAIHGGNNTHQYTEFLIQVIKDFKRCIDYLETRQDIDSGRVAYYGMSWGGGLGAIIPAVEDRLKASILLPGVLDDLGRPEVFPLNYVGRVKIPTLMLNGRYDSLCPYETTMKPMFDLLGTPQEHKELKLYETDHIPPRVEYIKETLAWLDKYLGPVKR
jgi:predicted Ser/Thr protein kinase/pimeloyl-ACP methyl ester carboxylesterase